jgi:Dolichyl-phosphate-mannose-protein mannosyltransferase
MPSPSSDPTRRVWRALALTLALGFALPIRLINLGASGFGEDEISKWRAVQAYRAGQFSANAEHPMLMKLAAWTSIGVADWWNAHVAGGGVLRVSPEAALRAPNAVAGAATTGMVFLLGETLFGTSVASWAATLWAFDVNAAAINRIAKEDTLLLFFLLLGTWLYERGARSHTASGAAFGLMLASKYMPHFFGLHALYAYVAYPRRNFGVPGRILKLYLALAGAFLAANLAILMPSTWSYLLGYVNGGAMRHTGYMFAHRLYVNGTMTSPWGVPPWFYITYLITKVPAVVLAAATAGMIWTWRHPDHRGAVFIRVFLVFTLLPYSLVSGKFVRYMLPVLAVVDLSAGVGMVMLLRRVSAPAPAAAAILVMLAANVWSAAPHYSLAQNTIGRWMGPPGSLFPDDEFYDAGMREAVAMIAPAAGPGAVLCSEAPAVVAEYLARRARADVAACSLARDGLPMRPVDTWVIAQEGHTYFENAAMIDQLRRRTRPFADVHIAGGSALSVFHLENRPHGHPE